ncbi:MAG: type II secretion system protein GspG [Treponema sp.]|nr:type II secretion system protein GspG [Treponema sp.]
MCSEKCEGFTFVETIAVLAIGAVLTAGSAVSATKLIKVAKETAARNQISEFSAALQSYFLDCGRFPTSEQGIGALWEKPVLYPVPENWNGPYVIREPGLDPWGSEFVYVNSENADFPADVPESLPFIIISYGADKEKGGEGNGVDIVSWK